MQDRYTWMIAGFVLLILGFLWQVFGTLNQGNLEMNNFLLYFGASVVILLVCAILAILGWSIQTAGMGYAFGFMIVAALLTIMSATRTVGNLDNPRMEFWNDGVEPAQVSLLRQTVDEVIRTGPRCSKRSGYHQPGESTTIHCLGNAKSKNHSGGRIGQHRRPCPGPHPGRYSTRNGQDISWAGF